MNNVFNNLINSLSEEFKKYELNENIQLNPSKIAGYDLQINNLVKYNKSDFCVSFALSLDLIPLLCLAGKL